MKAKSTTKERILIVDGNWYLHRAMSTLQTNRPIEDVIPYKLLGMVIKDALDTRSTYIAVAFDGPKVFRYKVYPKYKSDRGEKKHREGVAGEGADQENAVPTVSIYEFLPYIFTLFSEVGIVFYQPKTFEADDVLRSVAHKYGGDYIVIGGTQDKDAYQYLTHDNSVILYDASYKNLKTKKSGRYIKAADAEKRFGVPVHQMLDYQTLVGDAGDCVPNIKDIKAARAKKILAEFGTLSNWYKKAKGDEKVFITSQLEALRRNRKLVELSKECPPPNELSEWKLPKVKSKNPFLSARYHDYHNWLYPKSKGLFG
jgi:DNA polymerase-1